MTFGFSCLLIGLAGVVLMMFVLWVIHLRLENAAIVDVGWAASLGLLGSFYTIVGPGWWARRLILGLMVGVWASRLAIYLLLTRVVGHREEGRYQALRHKWRTALPVKFLAFFELQGLLAVVLSLPFLIAALNPAASASMLEWAGAVLWMVAFAGEALADAQLAAFKRRPEARGRTCQHGLWRFSRHPNYFFESLVWVAFAVFSLASPHGYLALLSPALMLYFILYVSGIPATEQQALRSRGEEYRRYQETTSAFVPWFRDSA